MSDITPHPKPIQLDQYDGIAGIYSYIIEDYGDDGLCCRIDKTDQGSRIMVGDWSGNVFTPTTPVMNLFMRKSLPQLLSLFSGLKLLFAQFYFAMVNGEFVLVDISTGDNKYISPGTIEELFGKTFRVQNVIDKIKLSTESIASLRQGVGKYSGNLIIKPNRCRSIRVDGKILPLYIRISR